MLHYNNKIQVKTTILPLRGFKGNLVFFSGYEFYVAYFRYKFKTWQCKGGLQVLVGHAV